jgi:hypothetical protein
VRYRALSADGDYTFGAGSANFLVNDAACVAQSIQTRLLLWEGEWFLDQTIGTPYSTQILGKGTKALYDQAIRQRVLETDGVSSIDSYSSNLDDETRALTVQMTVTTIYGQVEVPVVL